MGVMRKNHNKQKRPGNRVVPSRSAWWPYRDSNPSFSLERDVAESIDISSYGVVCTDRLHRGFEERWNSSNPYSLWPRRTRIQAPRDSKPDFRMGVLEKRLLYVFAIPRRGFESPVGIQPAPPARP
jgi:hypothetical protein